MIARLLCTGDAVYADPGGNSTRGWRDPLGTAPVRLDDPVGMGPRNADPQHVALVWSCLMSFFPIEDPQFWIVSMVTVGAVIVFFWRRKGGGGGSCKDCPER